VSSTTETWTTASLWTARFLLALAGALPLAGCSSPLTGSWIERDDANEDTRNAMTIGSDQTGKATLHYLTENTGSTPLEDTFEIEWEEVGGGEFELAMTCVASTQFGSAPCSPNDFVMTCGLGGKSDNELDCDGSDPWQLYTFAWEKD
jgi:hypothetical protein